MHCRISAKKVRVQAGSDNLRRAYVLIEVTSEDNAASFNLEVGVLAVGDRQRILENARKRLITLFRDAIEELEQGPLALN
jgi:hypothetical protein